MAHPPFLSARGLAGLAGLVMLLPLLAIAQVSVLTTEQVRVELLAHAPTGVAPGKPLWLALAIGHQPRWHTYWKNPGDSGLPTSLSWQLSDGAVAGEIAWPTPQALPVGPLMNYGYEDTVLLPVMVTIPAGFKARELQVKLQAEWLACKDVCVPESGEFALKIPARAGTAAHAKAFDTALSRVPQALASVQARAAIERRALKVEVDGLPPTWRGRALRFFSELAGVVDHAAAIEQRWDAARWVARIPLSSQRSESPATMDAVLVAEDQPIGIRVHLPITGSWATAASKAMPVADAQAGHPSDNAHRSPPSTKE